MRVKRPRPTEVDEARFVRLTFRTRKRLVRRKLRTSSNNRLFPPRHRLCLSRHFLVQDPSRARTACGLAGAWSWLGKGEGGTRRWLAARDRLRRPGLAPKAG